MVFSVIIARNALVAAAVSIAFRWTKQLGQCSAADFTGGVTHLSPGENGTINAKNMPFVAGFLLQKFKLDGYG